MNVSPHQMAQSGTGWAVATPHWQASSAAADSFRRGGNAVDAALAAAAMLTVVYPNQCSVGGDLIALVGTADGEVHVVNASGRAPAGVDADEVAAAHGSMPVTGPIPVTVPGMVSGWQAMADRWGRAGLGDALRDAQAAAEDGVQVADGLARALVAEARKISENETMRALFAPHGRLLTAGQQLRQPALAASLALLAEHGSSVMYDGEIGEALVGELRDRGSSMTMQDLHEHRVDFSGVAATQFAGVDYISTTANTQGLYFLEALAALEVLRAETGPLDPLGADAGRIAGILAQAAADRERLLGDPGPGDELVGELLSEANARRLVHGEVAPVATVPARASGDTVAITTADASGQWVSLIESVFHAFGSALCEPRTGIILHNRGASFSLAPGSASRLTARHRPPHTLMPVLKRRDGALVGAHGAMGGRAQPQIHAQLALHLAAGASAQAAVFAPRWVLGATRSADHAVVSAQLEADVPQGAGVSIARAGFPLDRLARRDDEAGHAQVIQRVDETVASPVFECASDPRADGAAIVGDRQ